LVGVCEGESACSELSADLGAIVVGGTGVAWLQADEDADTLTVDPPFDAHVVVAGDADVRLGAEASDFVHKLADVRNEPDLAFPGLGLYLMHDMNSCDRVDG
jgi:hypothetical protein